MVTPVVISYRQNHSRLASTSAACRTTSRGGVGRMHNFNAGIAGKPGSVERENGGEAMHLHGCHQTGIMGGLADNPILNDQAFPDRIDRWRLGQELKHAFDSCQFDGNGGQLHAQSVLLDRPCGNYPQLDEVLRNDVKFATPSGHGFDRDAGHFALRMCRLQGPKQRAGIDKHAAKSDPDRCSPGSWLRPRERGCWGCDYQPRHRNVAPTRADWCSASGQWTQVVDAARQLPASTARDSSRGPAPAP